MKLREADVIVVGAGPAGSAAAITLAARGMQVVLLDRSPFPRPKICGDGLTPRALSALRRLGVWERLEPHSQVVNGLRTLHLQTGLSWDGPLPSRLRGMPSSGAVVRREVLDELLRQRAVALGASFVDGVAVDHVEQSGLDNCVVSGRSRSGRWVGHARAVVLATGVVGAHGGPFRAVSSPGLEGLALRQYWANVSIATAFTICIPLEVDSRPQAGYGWIFPVSGCAANVGIGLYGVRDGRYLRRAYDTFVTRLRDLEAACWSRAEPCGGLQGGRLLSGVSPARMVRGRIVRAGDAAAVANPFTGEGIAQALDSGELVALAVLEDFASPGCIEYAVSGALEQKFPHTRRIGEHLPWLASRGQFVAEFWGAVSSPSCIVSAAVRRMTLEEQLDAGSPNIAPLVERTWQRMRSVLEGEYPLLAELCEAVRAESQYAIDAPVQAFWQDHRERQVDEIALMLALGATICVVASEVREGGVSDSHTLDDQEGWAVQTIALGAMDVLMAQFFKVAAHVAPAVAEKCARAVTRAFGDLSARIPLERILATMACEFGVAARTALPEAA